MQKLINYYCYSNCTYNIDTQVTRVYKSINTAKLEDIFKYSNRYRLEVPLRVRYFNT